ncbi:hypothetical protein LNN38_25630 [Pseudomonas sp. LA21]|uniref:hypothetical protein n=1 Tax=Pseudomonas sp. LA21 TaxID=2893373 RepID=UPI001FB76AEE|nr:hypothetical protein [Pseudomonas sp. LA21]MCJ1888260.1 hypothetical protein [Pseudomonas sp. LA21]
MFWRRNKKFQVEVINPRLVLEASPALEVSGGSARRLSQEVNPEKLSLDVSLKLAAVVAAMVNACLIVFGYMRYLALLELFGIERSEVSFSIADLLAYGYGATINMVVASREAQFVFGGLAGLIAITLVLLLWQKGAAWKQMLVSWLLGILIAFLPTVPMYVGYYPAKRSLLAVAAEHLGIEASNLGGVKKRTEVLTSEGWRQGDVLLANAEFTYLLADSVVYKVRLSDGVIVRKTQLIAELK